MKKKEEIKEVKEETPKKYKYRWVSPNNIKRRKEDGWINCADEEVKAVMTSMIKGSFTHGEPQFYMKKEVS